MRIVITQVETHVTHQCNMTCQSCTHFSNEGFTGRHTPESFLKEMLPWSQRIAPRNFLLLGGEPTLNPDLAEICHAARDLWPDESCRILLVTNGFFLRRHPLLAAVLRTRKIVLDISIHHDSPEYLAKLRDAEAWVAENKVEMRWRESFRDWLEYYKGVGKDARPFDDGRPEDSWRSCPSKWCFTIRDGMLCKCPMTAWLPMHVEKFGDGDGAWTPYLSYKPLNPDATDAELEAFVNRRAEDCCRMCPADPQPLRKADPLLRLNLERVKQGA